MSSITCALNTQAYYNVPYGLHDIKHACLRPVYAARFMMLYKIYRSGKDSFSLTYEYLAKIFNCCVRTAKRTMIYLSQKGFLEIKKTIKNNKNQANTYILKTPLDMQTQMMSAPKRSTPSPQIDYSVPTEDEDSYKNDELVAKEEKIRPLPDNDKRNYLKDAKPISGPLAAILERMKEKIAGRTLPPEKKREPYHAWVNGDKNVTTNILNNKIYNKSASAPPIINFCDQKFSKKPAREVSSWAKVEIEGFVKGKHDISAPRMVIEEGLYFVAHSKDYNEIQAVNAFKGFLEAGLWTTPIAMRYKGKQK